VHHSGKESCRVFVFIIQLSQMVIHALRFIHKDFVEEQHKTKMKQNGKFALKI
jgi:hypothetical protein